MEIGIHCAVGWLLVCPLCKLYPRCGLFLLEGQVLGRWFRAKGDKSGNLWHFSHVDSWKQVIAYNPFVATVAWSDCLNSSENVFESQVAEHFLFLETVTGALHLKRAGTLCLLVMSSLCLKGISHQQHVQEQGAVLGWVAEVPARAPAVPLKTFTPLQWCSVCPSSWGEN